MKYKYAIKTIVNGAISWWLAEIYTHNGTRFFRRIRTDGKKSRPAKVGQQKLVKWVDRGDRLTRPQVQWLAEIEWEIKTARAKG